MKETLEEAAEIFVNNRFVKQICNDESYPDIYASKAAIVESHILFAKWQQEVGQKVGHSVQVERMYSEEDMRKCCDASKRFERPISEGYAPNFNEFIEQFKKINNDPKRNT